jgi:hypothetical protein
VKGHFRERSPGHWAIVIELRDPATNKRRRKLHSFAGTTAAVPVNGLFGKTNPKYSAVFQSLDDSGHSEYSSRRPTFFVRPIKYPDFVRATSPPWHVS